MYIFWQHARRYPGAIFLLCLGMVGGTLAEVYIPYLYRRIFNLLAAGAPADELIAVLYMVLGSAAVMWAFWRLATFTNDFFQPRVMADILNTCFKYLHNHSYNFFTNHFAGSLVKKVGRLERAFEGIADVLYWNLSPTILRVALILIILSQIRPLLAVTVSIWAAFYISFNYLFARFKLKYDIENASLDTKVGGFLADTFTNNINLKLFNGYKKEVRSFGDLTGKQFRIRKLTWNLGSLNEAIQGGLMIGLEFVVMFIAIKYWQAGQLTIGDFALIQAYLVQIFTRLWDLGRHIKQIYERLADAEEMTNILMTPQSVVDVPNAAILQVEGGGIGFENVTFGYHEKHRVLKNFNLFIKPGERVALIGPSGGGKTTIVKLLFRFFDIQKGEILIDGQNISLSTQDSLHSALSLVPQEPILFHRSLYDNIGYAKPGASREEVIRAAKLAHCHEFITSFPEQYETFVGERGVKLSGGERQRVAIARAILKAAPILVLDEATSSLDSESEYFIQDALKNLMRGKTTIVIAHRLSTIMQMDRIVVIDRGAIKEEGKHKELLKAKQGIYQKLWGIQAGGFTN